MSVARRQAALARKAVAAEVGGVLVAAGRLAAMVLAAAAVVPVPGVPAVFVLEGWRRLAWA